MGMNITKMPYNPGNYMAKRTGEKNYRQGLCDCIRRYFNGH